MRATHWHGKKDPDNWHDGDMDENPITDVMAAAMQFRFDLTCKEV
jgi:hypothetical protein